MEDCKPQDLIRKLLPPDSGIDLNSISTVGLGIAIKGNRGIMSRFQKESTL
jgi:hypothetical protein